jgi:hypothetical protein
MTSDEEKELSIDDRIDCDLHIQILCDFVLKHSEDNSYRALNNLPVNPVSCFLIKYCQELRLKN